MKGGVFFFILLFLPFGSFCQEFIEANDRAITLPASLTENFSNRNSHSFLTAKTFYVKDQSLYNPAGDRLIQNMLLDSGNEDIIRLVKKAKKNRKREFIAFAAIPMGIVAAACIRQGATSQAWMKPAGITFLAASLSCIIVSPIASHRKTSNYKKAVKLYNTRF